MRQITKDSVNALFAARPFRQSNMEVQFECGFTFMYLHGNLIAKIDMVGDVYISHAGWCTVTTKERLNGVLTAHGTLERIRQVKGEWVYGFLGEGTTPFDELTNDEGWLRV